MCSTVGYSAVLGSAFVACQSLGRWYDEAIAARAHRVRLGGVGHGRRQNGAIAPSGHRTVGGDDASALRGAALFKLITIRSTTYVDIGTTVGGVLHQPDLDRCRTQERRPS